MRDQKSGQRKKSRERTQYIIDYRDKQTLKYFAYNCGAICIFFWFLYNYTTIFQDTHDVLLGKKDSVIIKNYNEKGLLYVFEHNAVLSTIFFVLVLMLIYIAIYYYLKKCTDYFGPRPTCKSLLFTSLVSRRGRPHENTTPSREYDMRRRNTDVHYAENSASKQQSLRRRSKERRLRKNIEKSEDKYQENGIESSPEVQVSPVRAPSKSKTLRVVSSKRTLRASTIKQHYDLRKR